MGDMTIVITWWMIPAAITIVGLVWAICIYNDGGGYLSGMGNVFMLVPVLAVSMVAWIVAAFLK